MRTRRSSTIVEELSKHGSLDRDANGCSGTEGSDNDLFPYGALMLTGCQQRVDLSEELLRFHTVDWSNRPAWPRIDGRHWGRSSARSGVQLRWLSRQPPRYTWLSFPTCERSIARFGSPAGKPGEAEWSLAAGTCCHPCLGAPDVEVASPVGAFRDGRR